MFTPEMEKNQAIHLHFLKRAVLVFKTPLYFLNFNFSAKTYPVQSHMWVLVGYNVQRPYFYLVEVEFVSERPSAQVTHTKTVWNVKYKSTKDTTNNRDNIT